MKTRLGKTIKVVGFILGASGVLFGATRARARPADTLEVLTGFSAKESCSCAFVVEQSDAYCVAFGQIGGFAVNVSIDRQAKTVTSKFAGLARTARFTEDEGCLTDALP